MAFYNGTVNSFADLRTAIFNACVSEGWVASGEFLTKGAAAIQVVNNTTHTSGVGLGLCFEGGTGVSSGALINPSGVRPRLGPPSQNISQPTWPMEYDIHIYDNPDEVFCIVKFNVDYYLWAAFGVSSIPLASTGLWVSAVSPGGGGRAGSPIIISATTGGGGGFGTSSSGAFFWRAPGSQGGSANTIQDCIADGLDGSIWEAKAASAPYLEPRIARQPNAWNAEGLLMRIQIVSERVSNKRSIVADINNARYVRIDNYTPDQLVTLGSDRWKVYPFYRKNAAERNGGTLIDHTGTFGWAIRYTGP